MSEPRSLRPVEPNAVLRGGPLDGEKVHVGTWRPFEIEVGDERVVYRPTSELDNEFEALTIWVYDRTETG